MHHPPAANAALAEYVAVAAAQQHEQLEAGPAFHRETWQRDPVPITGRARLPRRLDHLPGYPAAIGHREFLHRLMSASVMLVTPEFLARKSTSEGCSTSW